MDEAEAGPSRRKGINDEDDRGKEGRLVVPRSRYYCCYKGYEDSKLLVVKRRAMRERQKLTTKQGEGNGGGESGRWDD